ncbi:MAG: B-box zinc finger protein [Actinomycetota bacterium]|nr:B-box zinc finger protein [Actinomycetota bacterium]
MAEVMRCYRHPKRETRVSCATCGRPICTECMRATDVGIKCPDDAGLPRSARTGVMKPDQILKSFLAGLVVALVGIPIVYILFGLPFQWLLSAAAGFGAGTFINRAGGRNGGPLAIVISVVATAIPFLVWLAPDILMGTMSVFGAASVVFAVLAAGLANRRS